MKKVKYEEVIDEQVEIAPMSATNNEAGGEGEGEDNNNGNNNSGNGNSGNDNGGGKKPIRPEPVVGPGGLSLDKPEDGE